MKMVKRGAFIVIEGMDRTGKTTQCKKLVENLQEKTFLAEYVNFPMRTTDIGKVINSYLQSKNNLSDEAIHLLFSANRWENEAMLREKLESGVTLILDRYCFSGVAYSAAKGLDLQWCKSSDIGLPKPDKVFYLTMNENSIQERNGYGNERYEVPAFQKKVNEVFKTLRESDWEEVVVNRSIEDIQDELLKKTIQLIPTVSDKEVAKIWL